MPYPSLHKPFCALIGGLLWPLAFAPWSFWPLILISVALAWYSFQQCSPKQALRHGYFFGLGLFGFGVSWLHVSIHVYGYTPLWLAVPMTALFAAVLALYPALLFWLSARLGGSMWLFAGFWVLADWLRGWFLTGFPWLYGGYAMIDTPLANLASIGGIWLLTLATVLSGLTIPALRHWRQQFAVPLSALLLWVLGAIISPSQFTQASGEPIKVALAQGNISQDIKWLLTQQLATRQIYADISAQADDNTLVVWPESAVTEFFHEAEPFLQEQASLLAARGGSLITGAPWLSAATDGEPRYYNSITSVNAQQVYHKQKLVPFGEYVPLQNWLRDLMPFFNLPMSSFSWGEPEQRNLNAQGITVAPFICYEILYPELVAQRSQDSDVLLTISNDAWFGRSSGPLQHFQMARLRAMETGRWLMRATNNGVTALVDPNGKVQAQLPQFERGLLQGNITPRQGLTPFQRTGAWPWLLLSTALVGGGIWQTRRRSKDV